MESCDQQVCIDVAQRAGAGDSAGEQNAEEEGDEESLDGGKVAGIVVAVMCILLICGMCCLCRMWGMNV